MGKRKAPQPSPKPIIEPPALNYKCGFDFVSDNDLDEIADAVVENKILSAQVLALREEYDAALEHLQREQEERKAVTKWQDGADELAEAVEAFLHDLDTPQRDGALDALVVFGAIGHLREVLRSFDATSERRQRAYDAATERARADDPLMRRRG